MMKPPWKHGGFLLFLSIETVFYSYYNVIEQYGGIRFSTEGGESDEKRLEALVWEDGRSIGPGSFDGDLPDFCAAAFRFSHF